MLKRWAVMSLVMLLVLGSMGAALAEEGDTEAVEEVSEPFELVEDLLTFVFYWGSAGSEGATICEENGSSAGGTFFTPSTDVALTTECSLDVAGPNGQVNHGSMVSAVVHWLKSGEADEVLEAAGLDEMPKGQLVKKFAHLPFGKGSDDSGDLDEDLELELEVEDEDDDGDGPPAWVVEKKANKVKGKKK